ncbi:Linker_histone domain-containing protein, partial [Cephalotus follicularis]
TSSILSQISTVRLNRKSHHHCTTFPPYIYTITDPKISLPLSRSSPTKPMDPYLPKSIGPPPQQEPPPIPLPPPPPTTTTDQIPNHTAHAANPTPSLPQTLNHPPYAEMICEAIGALKERNGSSKRAIAKYIEKVYTTTNLPPTHSALLTHHLKRLKNNGQLVMVKKSYKLSPATSIPRSDAIIGPNNIAPPVHVPSPAPLSISPAPPLPTSGPTKKGRGRPAKPKPKPNVPGPLVVSGAGPVQQPKRGPGRPPKNGPVVSVGPVLPGGPLMAKKGRGRPPKAGTIGPKKSPGRPRKPKSLLAPNGLKRGRGRPPKTFSQVPAQPQAMVVPYPATGVQNMMKPRGRPKKFAATAAAAVVAGKPRGRPPIIDGVIKPKKPSSSSGRPVGRPKKNTAAEPEPEPEPQQVAYADLKRKFEYFQTRVKQAVGVLKPQFSSESDISAIAAIQELEGLSAMGIGTPLREEPQPQWQQSPLLQI